MRATTGRWAGTRSAACGPARCSMTAASRPNHASFGAYGPQPGDGEATISVEQAHAEIDEAALAFLD